MKIEHKKIDEIVPYKNNTRTHSDEQVDQIIKSIKEFGFTNPILIDENDGIIAGHGRYAAAKKMGLTAVPCVVLSGLDEKQKRAYIIADNKIALNAGWDESLLKIEINELLKDGYDIFATGFDSKEINMLGIGVDNIDKTKKDEDDVPDIKDKIVIKRGDLMELGRHRLLCGDSTKEIDVVTLQTADLKTNSVHCISDPPYGIAYDPKIKKYGMIKNDDTFLDYIALAKKYTNGFFYMWTSFQVVDEWIQRIKKDFKKINNMIIWHKGGGGQGDCMRTLATDFEIGLVCNRGNKIQNRRLSALWDYQNKKKKDILALKSEDSLIEILTNIIDGEVIWKVKKDNTSSYLHPTQKPVEINEKVLLNFTKVGDVVLDLFLGSGSNLIACEKLGRKMFGMELDEKYAQIIVQRFVDFTGNKFIKINGKDVNWDEHKQIQ